MFSDMKPAERSLLEHCKIGKELKIETEERPKIKTAYNEIRGKFLRHLILSNNQEIEESGKKYLLKIDPKGILFTGIYISGNFDFSFCNTDLKFSFRNSKFENKLDLSDSKIRFLSLIGSIVPSFDAFRLMCESDIFLTDGFEAQGKVNFGSAEISGSLFCMKGQIINEKEDALICYRAKIYGDVFFNNGFELKGNLSFSSTEIKKSLIFSKLKITGNCILTSAKIDTITEKDNFWKENEFREFHLDGLEYNHLSGKNLDSSTLVKWLEKMPEFKPQPYKQLARVLRNMGHNKEANDIMIDYNNKMRKKDYEEFKVEFKQAYKISLKEKWNFFKIFIKSIFETLGFLARLIYEKTSGCGYKLIRVFITMFCVWLFCSLFYWNASKVAVFAPSNPLVFQKKDFYQCNVELTGTSLFDMFNWKKYSSSNNWIDSKVDGEYTTFNPFWYSLDVILPIVDLQVEKDWGQYVPSNDWTLNDFTRWLMWFEILFGWIYSLILVAILSGLAKNEKD